MKIREPSHYFISQMLSQPDPIRWVFAGDSITHGALHTMGWRDYTELFSERIRWEAGRMRDVVIKTGVSGWRVENLSADWDWSVAQHRPHVLSIALGTNDCALGAAGVERFKNGLKQLTEKALNSEPAAAVLLHTPTRILPADTIREPYLQAYVDAVREVAESTQAVLIDHHSAWLQEETSGKLSYWLSDSVHPNEMGHRAMNRLLLQQIGLWSTDGITSKLLIA